MIVRIVTYPAESVDDAREWVRERGPGLREAPGVAHAYFMSRAEPAEAGAIVLFESDEALDRYKASDAYRQAVEEIGRTWGLSPEPIREDVYQLEQV